MCWSGEHWSPRRLQRVVLLALLFLFIVVFETEITSGRVFRFGCFTCCRLTWMLGNQFPVRKVKWKLHNGRRGHQSFVELNLNAEENLNNNEGKVNFVTLQLIS